MWELGLLVSLGILSFTFAYMSMKLKESNENMGNIFFFMFMFTVLLSFRSMMFVLDDTGTLYEVLNTVFIVFTYLTMFLLMLFVLFLLINTLKDALNFRKR